MKIGSHNTFTYLPVKQWYLKPFAFMARCQEVDVWKQYSLGVRFFDLRVRFDGTDIILCHGVFKYKFSAEDFYHMLCKFNNCKGIYIRVGLETRKDNSKYNEQFKTFCSWLEAEFKNIKFVGGTNKNFDMNKPIYEFINNMPEVAEKHASVTSIFHCSSNAILRVIDDWFPKFYAKHFNKINIAANKNSRCDYMLIDFVNIK